MVSILVGLGLSALGLTGSGAVAWTYYSIAKNAASIFIDVEYEDYLVQEKNLKPGDHIYISGGASPKVKEATNINLYYHHMIYLGDGKIAEFGCENSKSYPLIGKMPNCSKIYRREYKKCISTEETISLCKRLDRCYGYGDYSAMLWNCEHFATLVKTKEYKSPQANKFIENTVYPIAKRMIHIRSPTCSRILENKGELFMKSEKLKNEELGHETFIASAKLITKGRFLARLRAGIADIQPPRDNTSSLHATAKVCTVGAEGEASPSQVEKTFSGVGVEATFVQVNADAGNFGGIRLGISADTSVGVGTEKMTVKLAGTGFKMDKSGTEITVLGTGIKLGSWVTIYGW